MPKEKLSQVLSDLKSALQRIYGDRLAKLVLFGSQARGDATEDSDIDVLVALRGDVAPGAEISRCGGAVADICLKHDVLISCIYKPLDAFEGQDSILMACVRREGVPV